MHIKPAAAVESFSSTETLTRFQRLDFHGVRIADFSVIQMNKKKLLYFQSTMFTEYLPEAGAWSTSGVLVATVQK